VSTKLPIEDKNSENFRDQRTKDPREKITVTKSQFRRSKLLSTSGKPIIQSTVVWEVETGIEKYERRKARQLHKSKDTASRTSRDRVDQRSTWDK
jgi:hypothetical protein